MKLQITDNKIIAFNEKKEEIGFIQFENYDDYSYGVLTTYVDPSYRGKNIGKTLVDELVKKARSEKKKIIPFCTYVQKLFNTDDSYKDIKSEIPMGC